MIFIFRLINHVSFLFFFASVTHTNDDRDYALKLGNCHRLCASKYATSIPTCTDLCTLSRACSHSSCSLFCSPDDDTCLDTCQAFTTSDTCDSPCTNVYPYITILSGGNATLTVNITNLPASVLAHVTLLNQNTSGTYDWRLNLGYTTFSGLYPWFDYAVEVVLFSEDTSCCTIPQIWQGSVSFDPLVIGGGPQFYPYPLQSDWISSVGRDSGVVASSVYLYPSAPMYNSAKIGIQPWIEGVPNDTYKLQTVTRGTDVNVRTATPDQLTSWKSCHKVDGVGLKCVYQLGAGYMFEIPSSESTVPVYDATDASEVTNLVIKPRTTCRYFPNTNTSLSATLGLECGKTNTTTNTVDVSFDSTKISIKSCFMSEVGSESISRVCCERYGLSCVHPASSSLTLHTNRSYLLYFLYDPDKTAGSSLSTCRWSKSCDGFYQRITPRDDITECPAPTRPPPSLVLSSVLPLVLLILGAGSALLWRYWVRVHRPGAVTTHIPSEEDALLGGELPRDAISKERYVDRGNFGYIFEGKLKVKIDDKEELTKQYEVALKILKTKVDEIENCSAHQENIKDAKKAMKAEIYMMKQIQNGRSVNRNVLRMYGYVVDAPPYILVLELCLINLTRYLRQIRIQIDNRTLTAEDAKKGTTLCMEEQNGGHQNGKVPGTRKVSVQGESCPGAQSPENGGAVCSSCVDNSCDECVYRLRTDSRLLSHSRMENKVTLAPPRERMLARGNKLAGGNSSYNDSVHGRMTRQGPAMDRFSDTVLTTGDLLNFCWQVSSGMDFLHSFDLIHRDLAADNILLKEEADGSLTLKICDFGQSRLLFNGSYVGSGDSVADRQRMFRLRWTAPEIKSEPKMWSKWSDIWSYGVFMWEVFSMGGHPYPGWPDHLVIDNLLLGLRMTRPPCCSETAWEIAEKCWSSRPEVRGQFCDIKFKLDQLMEDERDKNLGIQRSDYVFCDVPTTPHSEVDADDLGVDWETVSIRDIEDGEPLDLQQDHTEITDGLVIENPSIDRLDSEKTVLKVSVDVNHEEIVIHTDP